MARNEREMCNYFAQPYLRNGSSRNSRKVRIDRYRIPLRTYQNRSELNFPAERYSGFEPQGVSEVVTPTQSKCKSPQSIIPERNGAV